MEKEIAVIFDLDDTLIQERDFLESAYQEISRVLRPKHSEEIYAYLLQTYKRGGDPFGEMIRQFDLSVSKEDLLQMYRNHKPVLELDGDARELLDYLKEEGVPMGIVTDGRSLTQRNKIKALGLDSYVPRDAVIVSEEIGSMKPALRNFEHFHVYYPGCHYIYVGDNPAKDFVAPRQLGWLTVCLKDQGDNIHSQPLEVPEALRPHFMIDRLSDLKNLLKEI